MLDEVGAGTDPTEGSALARAILNHLRERGAWVVATTHYAELKAFAQNTPGVRNASVEFDVETLAPTYKLTIGVPGRSNALAIARRLGLPAEIVDEARAMVGPEDQQIEDLLASIQDERDRAAYEREQLAVERRRAGQARRQVEQRLAEIDHERQESLAAARDEARRGLEAFIIGSTAGPHPYPMMVRDFQSVIGAETKRQVLHKEGRLPDYVIACVGGGSNSMGILYSLRNDSSVQLIGVEAEGKGVETGEHAASITAGRVGVLHGNRGTSTCSRTATARSGTPIP